LVVWVVLLVSILFVDCWFRWFWLFGCFWFILLIGWSWLFRWFWLFG
jgi:hypothetical protein